MIDRVAILAAEDLPREKVAVPEWGGDVFLRTLTAAERDAFEMTVNDAKKKGKPLNMRAGLICRAACDENGKRLFTDDDAVALANKSGKVMDRLYDVASRLSGYGEKVAELEKNSESQGDFSSSS